MDIVETKKGEGPSLHFSICSEGSLGLCKSFNGYRETKKEKAEAFTFLFAVRVHWDYINPQSGNYDYFSAHFRSNLSNTKISPMHQWPFRHS